MDILFSPRRRKASSSESAANSIATPQSELISLGTGIRSIFIPFPLRSFSAFMTRWTDSKSNTHFINDPDHMPIFPLRWRGKVGVWRISKILINILSYIPSFFHGYSNLLWSFKKTWPIFFQDPKGKYSSSLFFGNLGDRLDGSFDVPVGIKSTQAKSDCSLWKSPNRVMGSRRAVKSWTTEDAKLFF